MRAVQVRKLDGPEAIEVVDLPEPTGHGVVIDVEAAGVAFPDALMSRGLYQIRPELPFVLGSELAGVVRSAPEGSPLSPGDRVAALTGAGSAMAEVVIAAPEQVFALPDVFGPTTGAGVVFNDLTVDFALRERGRLAHGETVLVHGAAGGIGTSVLRMAAALGAARVIAVVSSEAKAQRAREAGATDVVLVDNWLTEVRALTEGKGVDVIIDPVGGDRFTDSLRSLGRGGRLVVVGFTGGDIPTVKVNRLLLKNIEVVGAGWGEYILGVPGYLQEQWARLVPLYESGAIALPTITEYPVERAAEAVASLENRTATGKVVLTF